MKEQLLDIRKKILGVLDQNDIEYLEKMKVEILGKKGSLTQILKGMGSLSPEERPAIGQLVNDVRNFAEEKFAEAKQRIQSAMIEAKMKNETLDISLPASRIRLGHLHPITKVINELKTLFINIGYEVADGPEIETDYYNFEALNIPANHPAKDEQDTFYISSDFVLRTQTSDVQVRTMENKKPPIRIIAPGVVYRSDEIDATHSPMFFQMEGLVVDKGINMSHLKGSLEMFIKELFGSDTKTRFRPHHFQFTEPSAEMDASCFVCGGKGCRVCKDSGYIELLGCGMVHPHVLEMSGIDPAVYTGFAFGLGINRIAMMKYGIPDSRLMYENDVKFLKQF